MIFFRNAHKLRTYGVKTFFAIVLAVSAFGFVPQAKAGYWGEPIFATLMQNVLEEIKFSIRGALLGSAKVAAIEILNSKIGQLVGGTSAGQALFITNWQSFLYDSPLQNTELFMNDFYTLSTRGKYASANYIGLGDDLRNLSGNYLRYLVEQSQASIAVKTYDIKFEYDLDEYAASPDVIFSGEGDWRGFNAFFSNPANNPFGFQLLAEEAFAKKLAQEEEIKKIKAQSSGFVGPEKDGMTLAPAAAIEAKFAGIQDIGNKLIASASNPGEFLSGVVMSVVNSALNKLVQQGVGQVQANIRREVRNVDSQVASELSRANALLGPGSGFSRTINQRTNVNVNTNTPVPPRPTRGGQ